MSGEKERGLADLDRQFEEDWKKPINRIGVATLLSAAALSFLPCIYLYIVYGVFPPLTVALKAWALIATIFGDFIVFVYNLHQTI